MKRLAQQTKIIGLVAKNSCDYVAKAFAHLSAGHVVVPLQSAADAYRIASTSVTELVEPEDGGGWVDLALHLSDSPATALVAFTSGTEGRPKGVLLSHANLSNATRRIQQAMQLDASIREYVGVPVYHSFGFGRCRAIASVGGRAYLPKAGFDLREIRDLLEDGAINAISAVPSLWRLVLEHRDLIEPLGHRVKWIEIGSQSMRVEEKRALCALFPHARIVQHYGLTEASRSTFLDVRAAASDYELDSVGEPNGDVEVQISADGRIKVRGGHVAQEILVDGKRVKSVDADGWLITSDLGEWHGRNLYFKGRFDDIINCGGIKLAPEAIEDEIKSALGVRSGIAVAKIPDAARGEGVLVALEPPIEHDDAAVRRAAEHALRGHGVNAGSAVQIIRIKALPITDSGKIRRSQLARLYHVAHGTARAADGTDRAADEAARPAHGTATSTPSLASRLAEWFRTKQRKPSNVREVFARAFPGRDVLDTDTFVRLGGDSLCFAEVSIALGDVLGQLPNDWQNFTIADLERARSHRSWLQPIDTALLLRFVCIVEIVTGHFTWWPVAGGTFALVAVAGYNFSRFQLPNVLSTGSVRSILFTAARIAIPTLVVIAAIQCRHLDLDLAQAALVSNWHDAAAQDLDFWFVEMMTQLLLILAALLCLPAVRQHAAQSPTRFTLVLLATGVGLALFAPLVWSSAHLYDRVPHMLLWLFMLGGFIQQATTPTLKAGAAALVVVLPLLVWGRDLPLWLGHGREWVWGAALLLLFTTKIRVPYPINRLACWIGGASMFIYITHWSVQQVWHRISPIENEFIDVVVAIAAGVVAWWLWEQGARALIKAVRARRGRPAEQAPDQLSGLEETGTFHVRGPR